MRNNLNKYINWLLVFVILGLVFFSKKIDEIGNNKENDSSINLKDSEESENNIIDDKEYGVFFDYNKKIQNILNDKTDYNHITTKETNENLKLLYKETEEGGNTSIFNYKSVCNGEDIQAKVLSSYLVYDASKLDIPTNNWVGLSKSKAFYTNDGKLREGYAYCVVELQVTNTSNQDIGLIMTNPAMELHFLDENAGRYWLSLCCYFSYQPGDSEKNAAKLYGFEVNESFVSKYVFTVPVSAFKYFRCCLVVSPGGSGTFIPKYSTMVVLDSFLKNKKEVGLEKKQG